MRQYAGFVFAIKFGNLPLKNLTRVADFSYEKALGHILLPLYFVFNAKC